jgi:hypothetical protein
MEQVLSGKRLDSIDVGSLALAGDNVKDPLIALDELIEDGYLHWKWFGINKYLVVVESEKGIEP